MSTAPARRQAHIETMRGIACILLVAYHVIGNDLAHGMHVPDGSGWRFLTELFTDVRMPLFSFISGYVFTADPASWSELKDALVKKIRRLALPLLTVSSLFWGVSHAVYGETVPYLDILYLPYEHFWYLQATILIMATVLVAAFLAGSGRRAAALMIVPMLVVFLAVGPIEPDLFSITQAIYLSPYFLTGYLVKSWSVERRLLHGPKQAGLAAALGGLVVVLLVMQGLQLVGEVRLNFDRQAPLGLVLGLASCFFLLTLRLEVEALAWIGTRSYPIYLLHVFFTAGVRAAMHRLEGAPDPLELFAVGLAAGIGMPILVSGWLMRWPPAALLVLGVDLAPRREQRSRTAPAAAE